MKYLLAVCLLLAACGGSDKSATTKTLETGAAVLQNHDPVNGLDMYLDGFHPLKATPSHQMEAHHYCRQSTEDVAQCVLFDGSGKDARMNGIEYIVSGKVYEALPADEKQLWHPHNYEILSGLLVAPGIPEAAEKELMRKKMNSYGKTYHFIWGSGPVPLGEPKLAWSFTEPGQLRPDLLRSRDQRMGIKTEDKEKERQDLSALVPSPN